MSKPPLGVDPEKCPTLHRALTVTRARQRAGWVRVVELKKEGRLEAADRLAAKLMGVKSRPMNEETKEKLRAYAEEHREEIREKRKAKARMERRTRELTKARSQRGGRSW